MSGFPREKIREMLEEIIWKLEDQEYYAHRIESLWNEAMPKLNVSFVGGAAPTHYCKICGALWRLWNDGSWNLRSKECGKCCDNAVMGDQIEAMTEAMPKRLTGEDLSLWFKISEHAYVPASKYQIIDALNKRLFGE
jgi:hypothetical protein